MSASAVSSVGSATFLEAEFRLNIMWLRSDLETGQLGQKDHDHLVIQCTEDFYRVLSLWRFDVLQETMLRALAGTVVGANMLIISALNGQRLPPTDGGWMEAILERKRNSPAPLVVLFDRNDGILSTVPIRFAPACTDAARGEWIP
jgi:hypothetical protein